MQEFLGEDNVPKDSQDAQQMNTCINHGINQVKTINLDDLLQSFAIGYFQHPQIINLGDSSNFTTLVRSNN
jgi:hypothetical protein